MIDTRTYIDAFPDIHRGIFSYLKIPWNVEQYEIPESLVNMVKASSSALDELLFIEYGERPQSVLLRHYDNGDGVKWDGAQSLAHIIGERFWPKWAHLWKAIAADYEPIDNYNALESETIASDGSESGSETLKDSTTNSTNRIENGTTTNNLTDNETHTRTLTDTHSGTDVTSGNNSEKMHVLNTTNGKERQSATGKNSTAYGHKVTYGGNETDKVTHTGNVTISNSSSVSGTGTQDTTKGLTRNTNESTIRTLTRKGNIGVTTSAQMIQGEVTLWSNYNFFADIVRDVADVLTLPIFT